MKFYLLDSSQIDKRILAVQRHIANHLTDPLDRRTLALGLPVPAEPFPWTNRREDWG